jgi:hypothetical protein
MDEAEGGRPMFGLNDVACAATLAAAVVGAPVWCDRVGIGHGTIRLGPSIT